MARERQAVAGRPHGTRTKQRVSRGTASVKAAADNTLEKHSENLAKLLYEGLLGGNAALAKLLFALAEGQIDCEDAFVVERYCSLAEKLASEQEWTGPVDEAEAESSFGQLEPEG